MATILLANGCNHLFYHPDNVRYTDPSQFQIAFDEHFIKTPSGEKLHAWHLKTPTSAKGVVLHFHGNAQNMSAHFLFVAWLVKHGYDVVTFDYRGYGQSTGKPTRHGLIEDGDSVLKWLSLQFPGLPKFVIGQSLGGAVAATSVALYEGDDLAALIIDSGFDSYRGIARDKLGSVWLTWPLQWPLSFLISDSYSPRAFLDRIALPVLVIHGTDDYVIPYRFGKRMFDELSTESKAIWTLAGAGHTAAFMDEKESVREDLIRYLDEMPIL